MKGALRAAAVCAVVVVATWGEGGAAAPSLLATHLMVAIAMAMFVAVFPGESEAPSFRPAAAWLVFAACVAAGAMRAPYAYAAWLVMVELAAFASIVWLAAGNRLAVSHFLPPVVAVIAAAHGIGAVAERLRGSPRPASTFLNPNHLAAWLAAAVLLLAGVLSDRTGPRVRVAYGAAVAAALAGLFVSGSRGAALGLLIGAVALAASGWSRRNARARRVLLAGTLVVVLVAAAGAVFRFRTDDDPYRFHRTRIWGAVLRAALRSPWLGTGPGQFAAAAPNMNFPLADAPLRYERGFRTPHSDALRAVAEFGFPAALAALAAAALGVTELFRRRHALAGVERGAVAALLALAAQALVDDLSTRPALTMLGAALVGLLLARPREPGSVRRRTLAGAVFALLLVLALGVGELAGFLAWHTLGTVPRGRLDDAQLHRLREAISWNPMLPDAWARLAEHHAGDPRALRIEDYAAAREAAEHARRLQPNDAFYAKEAARVEATSCLAGLRFVATCARAVAEYDAAFRLARTDATIPLEEARFLLQTGDGAEARRAAARALDVEPRAASPRLCLAEAVLVEDGSRGVAQARSLLDEAAALSLRPGEVPTSPYDAALRSVDPARVAALRGRIDALAAEPAP